MTINEAKKIYYKYECSLFAMAREEKSVYEDYKALNLSREIESGWRQELFFDLYQQVKRSGDCILFNKMYNLSDELKNQENLFRLVDALKNVTFDSIKERAYVSEVVLGRKELAARSGMIYWAYDLGEIKLAGELLIFALDLLNCKSNDEKVNARIANATEKCYMIDRKLELGICATNLQ